MPTTDEVVVDDEVAVELPTCQHCEMEIATPQAVTSWSGQWLHRGSDLDGCSAVCSACRYRHDVDDMAESVTGELLCNDCSVDCASCSDTIAYAESETYVGDRYCGNCLDTCSECEERFPSDGEHYECEGCREQTGVRGLDGYHTTAVHTWLGGPVPQDPEGRRVGYYLGFELEVSANSGDVAGLAQWADQNMGPGAMEFKEDSSVNGFEIATQPMTPEFFESVKWESFFRVLNEDFPIYGEEPTDHGLHVHIGRQAFQRDDVAMAAFCYLLGQSDHLERIGRRHPTHYCSKVEKPVSSAIASLRKGNAQWERATAYGYGRWAINLTNGPTIEIRAFRSTRSADELRDAVRLVYVAAEYIRSLRKNFGGLSPRALHWSEFCRWAGVHYPEAFRMLTGDKTKVAVKK